MPVYPNPRNKPSVQTQLDGVEYPPGGIGLVFLKQVQLSSEGETAAGGGGEEG